MLFLMFLKALVVSEFQWPKIFTEYLQGDEPVVPSLQAMHNKRKEIIL